MTFTLAPDQEQFVKERIRKGDFATPDDVLRAAMESFIQQTRVAELPIEELELLYPDFRKKIAEGLAQADAGMLSDGEEFFAQLEREDGE